MSHTCLPHSTQKNKCTKFHLCIALGKAARRGNACENNSSPFFMSISISVGVPLEWSAVNGLHYFRPPSPPGPTSKGNADRNSTALPLRVTAVMSSRGGRPRVCDGFINMSPEPRATPSHLKNLTLNRCDAQVTRRAFIGATLGTFNQ